MSITNDFFDALNDPKAALWSAGVAFNRSNPLPLDKWSVFESMDDAVVYASSNAVAYPGQIIAVHENNSMSAYVLEENIVNEVTSLTLKPIGIIPVGDGASIEIVDGKIGIKGFADAETNAQLVKNAQGELVWVKPNTDTIDGLTTAVADLQNSVADLATDVEGVKEDVSDLNTLVTAHEESIGTLQTDVETITKELDNKANADDVLTKNETEIAIDTKIAQAITSVEHLKRKILNNYEELEAYLTKDDALHYIYMVPTDLQYIAADDKYDEYIIIETEVDGNKVKKIEKVGSWEVDLSDYVKTETLEDYATAKSVEDLSNSITTLGSTIEEGLSELEGTITSTAQTLQGNIDKNCEAITKLTEDLNDVSNIADAAKTQAEENSGAIENINIVIAEHEKNLITSDERAKLEKLVLGDDGSVAVSGTINASNVKELDTWLKNNGASHIADLTEDNLSISLVNKINFITAVDDDEFTVAEGTLNLNVIEGSKVNLETNAAFTSISNIVLEEHEQRIENLEALSEQVNTIALAVQDNTAKIKNLDEVVIPAINKKFEDYVTITTFTEDISAITEDISAIKDILTWKEMVQ